MPMQARAVRRWVEAHLPTEEWPDPQLQAHKLHAALAAGAQCEDPPGPGAEGSRPPPPLSFALSPDGWAVRRLGRTQAPPLAAAPKDAAASSGGTGQAQGLAGPASEAQGGPLSRSASSVVLPVAERGAGGAVALAPIMAVLIPEDPM